MNELKFEKHPNFPEAFRATLKLKNGYSVSVIYGPNCYGNGPEEDKYEIAIFDSKGGFVQLSKYDDVLGWQTMDEVQRLINFYKEIPCTKAT